MYVLSQVLARSYFFRVYKNHLKMVKGCRIDTGLCKKVGEKKTPNGTQMGWCSLFTA